jgi:hypothetical protein
MTRARMLAILFILLPGWLMVPLQANIDRQTQHLKYGGMPVTREIREQISQEMAIALLAGFRGIAADFVWFQGQDYWGTGLWFKQVKQIEIAVLLQPQSIYFWDTGAWHMAWNIGYAERVATNNATLAEGIRRERQWHDRARAFLERGIQNIPNRYDLYYQLAWLYQDKLVPDCGGEAECLKERYGKAAEYYAKAASFKEARFFMSRNVARCLEKAGDVRAAYQLWCQLWTDERQKQDPNRGLVIPREIRRLEGKLAIPENERYPLLRPAAKTAS